VSSLSEGGFQLVRGFVPLGLSGGNVADVVQLMCLLLARVLEQRMRYAMLCFQEQCHHAVGLKGTFLSWVLLVVCLMCEFHGHVMWRT